MQDWDLHLSLDNWKLVDDWRNCLLVNAVQHHYRDLQIPESLKGARVSSDFPLAGMELQAFQVIGPSFERQA